MRLFRFGNSFSFLLFDYMVDPLIQHIILADKFFPVVSLQNMRNFSAFLEAELFQKQLKTG
jgi:hypothetical protein